MAKSPAFQMYPADFFADRHVLVMCCEDVGAYVQLMFSAWLEGALPDDVEELAAIAKMPVDRFRISWEKRIARCFEQREDGMWVHPRLEKERAKQQAFREKRIKAGKASAESRSTHAQQKRNKRSTRVEQVSPISSSDIPVGALAPDLGNWTTRFGNEWQRAKKGTANFGRIGTALKPLVERDGPDAHWDAWCRFVRSDKARFGPEYFANNRSDFDPPPTKLALTSAGTTVMSPAEMQAYKAAELESINAHRKARGDGPLVA